MNASPQPFEARPPHEAWFVPRSAVTPLARGGTQGELLRLLGAEPSDSSADMPEPAVWRVRAGATLLHEGAGADWLHVVRSGSFKCSRSSEDGYEQVLAFRGPGEVLGLEALGGGRQSHAVVALEASSVFALPVRELDAWRHRCGALDHALQRAAGRQLASAGDMAELMAAVAAEVRLARFLVWLSQRMATQGQSALRLRLRMGRRDIASLLGVAHETVSRSFGTLAELGLLRVDNREVEILDLPGLRACGRSTRGPAAPAESRHRAARSHDPAFGAALRAGCAGR